MPYYIKLSRYTDRSSKSSLETPGGGPADGTPETWLRVAAAPGHRASLPGATTLGGSLGKGGPIGRGFIRTTKPQKRAEGALVRHSRAAF